MRQNKGLAMRQIGHNRLCQLRGFSLIELLVVLVILSIATAFAVLAFSISTADQTLRRQTLYLAELFRFARVQAILQPNTMGALVGKQVIGFYQYQIPAHHLQLDDGRWLQLQSAQLTKQVFNAGVQIELTVAGQRRVLSQSTELEMPQIVFAPSGIQSSFSLDFSRVSNPAEHYLIRGSSDGLITWQEKVSP